MKKSFKQILGECIGEASMCWSDPPKGIFDSTRAKAIFDKTVLALEHPTCSTCRYFSEMHDGWPNFCSNPKIMKQVADDFYCAGHEEKGEL